MAAAATAQEASSSIPPRCTYDAFLSFRGKDTRKNFTSHLYGGLKQAGIHTFLDDDGIERGENIMAELRKAIQESKISIIVFSNDYASSRWCLNELLMIMEKKRTVGHTVVPVFYNVDPSHVKKQTGSFGEGFARLEKRFKEEMDKVESWRAALKEVAELGGMVLGNRNEWQFVQNIVQKIGSKLNQTILNVEPYLVGLDSRVKPINLWVQDGSNDVGTALIYGIGGIGKTTIAKTIYNLNFDKFEGRSFLENVKETAKQPNGLIRLQRQLLSNILKGKTDKVHTVNVGINKIKDAICCKRVLLVLDDVDRFEQLTAIIGMWEWFYQGSKIIITTRHERLERFNEVCEKFKVQQLDDNESLQLFSWHAFKQDHPTEGYMEWSRKAAHHCGGLPLALQVLGSSFFNRETNYWESALQNLEARPLALQVCNDEIQNVLKISYESLQNDWRNLFLDIACFFIGNDKDYIVRILDRRDFCATVGIQNLIDRCLLTVNFDKKLIMHQLLRDMGREIVRQESVEDQGKRSRLWCYEDAYTVLKEQIGTETVKGLTLGRCSLMEGKRGKTIVNVNYAKRHHEQDYLDKSTIGKFSKRCRIGFFSWKPMDTASEIYLPHQVALETKTFKKMHNLKLLQLNYENFNGDYEDFPKNLVWLCWHGFPLESIPTNFYLEKLIALDMRYSSVKHVWRGTKLLAELKFLNLSHSHDLLITPNFSGLHNLVRLVFKDCINLAKVDESIADLERLVFLNLKDCKKLRKLPREMGMLKSLEELNLSGCSKLDELPEDMRKIESLKVLYLDGTAIYQSLSTTRDTYSLKFWLFPRKGPYSTSFSWAFLPHSLQNLSVANCNLSYDSISCGLARLTSLKHLNLSGNPFHRLPESINNLTKLTYLWLYSCTRLQSLPKFPLSLEVLNIEICTSLERVPDLRYLPGVNSLRTNGCEKLVEVEGIFKLTPIKKADIAVLKSLGLSNLESLESIELHYDNYTGKQMKTSLQVLYECGITSIYLPRTEVPDCFVLKNPGFSISFHVPSPVGHKILSLNLCVLYAFDPEAYFQYDDPHLRSYVDDSRCVTIDNKTKGSMWTYDPIWFAPPRAVEEDMLWLSNWHSGDRFEGGDEIDVLVLFPKYFEVKMCGVYFGYEAEDKGTQSNTEKAVICGTQQKEEEVIRTRGCMHRTKFGSSHWFPSYRFNIHTAPINHLFNSRSMSTTWWGHWSN